MRTPGQNGPTRSFSSASNQGGKGFVPDFRFLLITPGQQLGTGKDFCPHWNILL
jgi:hypothetical protein